MSIQLYRKEEWEKGIEYYEVTMHGDGSLFKLHGPYESVKPNDLWAKEEDVQKSITFSDPIPKPIDTEIIRKSLSPSQVFTPEQLAQWAEDNGYELQEDEGEHMRDADSIMDAEIVDEERKGEL